MGVRCRDLSVRSNGRVPLDSVDLDVATGSACVLMGPSGAGKSTLLRAVAGLVEHDGSVAVGGRDMAGVTPHRRGVGLLFQHPRLSPTMNALDNVAYPLRLRGVRRADRRAQARHLLDEVGLTDRADAAPHELSGGEQQRVALARALCSEPDVLLLDEPLTGLDLPQRREMVRLLAGVQRARRLTWIVVTHDPDDAAALAGTVAILDHGRLIQHDTVDAIHARPADEVVCALLANTNVLRGEVQAGVAVVGDLRFSALGPDGPGVFTIPSSRLRVVEPGTANDGPNRLLTVTMTVVEAERRGATRLLRLESEQATLMVADTATPRCIGSAVDVGFDPVDLWRLPTPTRHHPIRYLEESSV